MNIFYLDKNPYFIAPQLNNKHTVKMILESAQMLWTAHRELDGSDDKTNATDNSCKGKHIEAGCNYSNSTTQCQEY